MSISQAVVSTFASGIGLKALVLPSGSVSHPSPGVMKQGCSTTDIAVMLISVAYPGTENWPQKPRKAVSEVLAFA